MAKRNFYVNQNFGLKKLKVNTEDYNLCLRLIKLEKSFEDVPLLDEESNDYNKIINSELLNQLFCRFIVCSDCLLKNIEFGDDLSCRMDYAQKIYIVCRDCSYKESTYINTIIEGLKLT